MSSLKRSVTCEIAIFRHSTPLYRNYRVSKITTVKSKVSLRQIGLIVFAVLVAMAVANYEKLLPHRWQTYTAPDRSFSVELPGEPAVETTQAPVDGGGTMPMTLVSVKPTKNTAYMCSYVEGENIERKSPDEALESARDGSLRKTQGTVISQNRTTVQGYPALDMRARARGNSLLDSRMIVVDKRLYMILAVATVPKDREEKTIQRMVESFNIIKH